MLRIIVTVLISSACIAGLAEPLKVECRSFARGEKFPAFDETSLRVFEIDPKVKTVYEQGKLLDSWFDDLDIYIEASDPTYDARPGVKRSSAVKIHRRDLAYDVFWKFYDDAGRPLNSRTLELLEMPGAESSPELKTHIVRMGVPPSTGALGTRWGKCLVQKAK